MTKFIISIFLFISVNSFSQTIKNYPCFAAVLTNPESGEKNVAINKENGFFIEVNHNVKTIDYVMLAQKNSTELVQVDYQDDFTKYAGKKYNYVVINSSKIDLLYDIEDSFPVYLIKVFPTNPDEFKELNSEILELHNSL